MPELPLQPAVTALAACASTLGQLEAKCSDPGRSPRMEALGQILGEVRAGLADMEAGADAAGRVLAALEDAGAQVGRLQVGCCAPDRLPLYADLLTGLTTAQMTVTRVSL